jgi:hypothetical protein
MSPDLRYGLITANMDLPAYEDSYQLYLWDRQQDTATLVTHELDGGPLHDQVISGSLTDDGRFVTFSSKAPDVVADDPTSHVDDVYLWDRTTGEIRLVSGPVIDEGFVPADRNEVISPDGSYVLYSTWLGDLDPQRTGELGWVTWSRGTGTSAIVDLPGYELDPGPNWPIAPISADGRWVLSQARDAETTFTKTVLWDTTDNTVTLVPEVSTPAADGSTAPLYPDAISADGSTVTGSVCGFRFDQILYEPCYVHLWTRSAGDPVLVTDHHDPDEWLRESSGGGVLSTTGRYLTFSSDSPNLIPDDTGAGGIFTWDRDG